MVVVLPSVLDRDLVLRFAPPAAGVRFESARFGLGESAERRTVVDVTAQPVPPGGLDLCLPVAASLRAEAGERGLRLLHYGEAGWAPVARSRDEAAHARVCASGVTELSPFAAGYDDLKPTFGDAAVAPQRYVQGAEIAPVTLPAVTGGDGPLTYVLAPALPEGLEYTAPADTTRGAATSGGTLTGTPAVPAEAAAYTLTVTDVDGDSATLTFTLEVEQDLMPSFGDAAGRAAALPGRDGDRPPHPARGDGRQRAARLCAHRAVRDPARGAGLHPARRCDERRRHERRHSHRHPRRARGRIRLDPDRHRHRRRPRDAHLHRRGGAGT